MVVYRVVMMWTVNDNSVAGYVKHVGGGSSQVDRPGARRLLGAVVRSMPHDRALHRPAR